jgi:hypothetical protein
MDRALDLIAGIDLRNPFLDAPDQIKLTVEIRNRMSPVAVSLKHPPVSFNAACLRATLGAAMFRALPWQWCEKDRFVLRGWPLADQAISRIPTVEVNCLAGRLGLGLSRFATLNERFVLAARIEAFQ